MTYGITLVNDGKFADSLDYLHRAQQLTPPYSVLLINLAIAENATNQSVAGEQHFKDALRLAPLSPDSYTYYARYLLSHARTDEARAALQSALELSSTDPNARELLREAKIRKVEPNITLGNKRLREGKFNEAIGEYEAALAMAPHSLSTLNDLAWVLSTCPDASLRNGARALELAQRANQLTSGNNAVLLRTLAAADAENGRFNEALQTAQRALEFATAQKNFVLADKLHKDVDLYRANLPLHPVSPPNAPPH